MKKLFAIIHQFVQEKQQPLQHEFQYKREMLISDATDHQLLQQFLNLQPNKSHVRRYSIIQFTTFQVFLHLNSRRHRQHVYGKQPWNN